MVGDSIMRGVGTSHNRHSLPGLVMSHASTKGVTVYAKDGARCHEVLEVCKELPRKEFSQVILFCGGMDIIYFSRANFIEKNLQELFLHAKSLSPHVIYISPADVGKAPIFIFPVSYIYTYRSRKFLSISRECAEKCGVTFVDYCNSVNKYYAEDKSHPNDNGYRNLFNLFKHHIVE
jgi:lysophospholipase L1-like esterase